MVEAESSFKRRAGLLTEHQPEPTEAKVQNQPSLLIMRSVSLHASEGTQSTLYHFLWLEKGRGLDLVVVSKIDQAQSIEELNFSTRQVIQQGK